MGSQRRAAIGIALATGIAGAAFIGWQRRGDARLARPGKGPAQEPRQWALDRGELVAAMERTLQRQRERLAETPDGPARDRVANFLYYYERRRSAV